jgi:hypothetical protein
MKLRTLRTDELPQAKNYRIFLYGGNRSGKTHFSATFPNPVFVVPKMGLNELKTVSDQQITVVPFVGLQDCLDQLTGLVKAIKKKPHTLEYTPKTIVFDNLTTANQLWLDELEEASGDERKVQRNKWGLMRSYIVAYMRLLHSLDNCHIIWICHPHVEKITEKVGGRLVEQSIGSFAVQGAAKDLIPGNCDLLLYSEDKDVGLKGTNYLVHAKKQGIWPAGVRLARIHEKKPFHVLGPKPSPSYDEMAKVLGLPSRDEVEDELDG